MAEFQSKSKSPHVDMTPMVDLGFLLITFFMLATSFSISKVIETVVPADTTDRSKLNCKHSLTLLLDATDFVKYYTCPPQEDLLNPHAKLDSVDFSKNGLRQLILKRQQESGSDKIQDWLKDFMVINVCPDCAGARLKKESLFFRIDNKNIAELANLDITELATWFSDLETRLSDRQIDIGREVLKEIRKRIGFLFNIGLDYLTLNRPLRSLSGGEAQRIRLATQIGTQLVGVLYIMDEPSIGLHQRDNVKLIQSLKDLRDLGNSVLVVEHDKDMMLQSDFIVDIGPGAGRHGGHIVGLGTPEEFLNYFP